MNIYVDTIRAVTARFPAVVPHLTERSLKALFDAKTYDFFLNTVTNLIESVYEGALGGEFNSIMQNLILGQISQAYEQAWIDKGYDLPPPEYLRDASQAMVLNEYQYIEPLYRSIIDAKVDETPIEPLLSRAPVWANRWTDAYNQAVALITEQEGGNLIWKYGESEHCPECQALNGIVASAREWNELGVRPQNPPNALITCGGWRCQCTLAPTDKRRSPRAYDTILNIITKL